MQKYYKKSVKWGEVREYSVLASGTSQWAEPVSALSPTGKPKSCSLFVLIDYLESAFARNYSLSIYCLECIFAA